MFEIYNEIVRDLLVSKMDRKGLQIHERPGKGFHILEKDLKVNIFLFFRVKNARIFKISFILILFYY